MKEFAIVVFATASLVVWAEIIAKAIEAWW